MKPIFDASAVRSMDADLIENMGMPSHTLMEIAAKSIAEIIDRMYPMGHIHIVCGPGNNGGDGLACARWLYLWERSISIALPITPRTKDAEINFKICEKIGLIPTDSIPINTDIIVDAVLGNGQHKPPRGVIAQTLDEIKEHQQSGTKLISIDMPSGLHPDTGHPFNSCCITPLHTLSIGHLKPGLFNELNAGQIIEIDIGLNALNHWEKSPNYSPVGHLLEQSDIIAMLPKERADSAKWNRGHVAVMGHGGAGVLTARASFCGGAGLVTLLAPKKEWTRLIGLPPEVILTTPDTLNPKRHDVLAIGPGWGLNNPQLFESLWKDFPNPMIVDADAITLLATLKLRPSKHIRILTPHIAEAARLLKKEVNDILSNPWSAMTELNQIAFSILKGPHTKIGSSPYWINPTGDWRLATAGSGDALTGLIAALTAKGLSPKEACATACYWHGQAGEKLRHGDSATDLIAAMDHWISNLKEYSPFR